MNDKPIYVGDEVYILEVPIIKHHKFVRGKVVKVTDKQVVIESEMKDRCWGDIKNVKLSVTLNKLLC